MNNKEMMELNPELDSEFDELVKYCMASGAIDLSLYTEYDVKRGLRESNGKGVLTGLTEISDVVGFDNVDGKRVPCEGRLYFQGIDVKDLISRGDKRRFVFEEVTYLLLFGALPTKQQLNQFIGILGDLRELSGHFVRDVIMKAPSSNIMNALQKSIVTLYSYDDKAEDISVANVLRQSLQLIAKLPVMSVFSYQSYMHFKKDDVLIIRNPDPECSTAENILRMLRPDGKYTELEAKVLDVALVLHAEHGGGNNSTFT
ncbi:MAG: citrate synthase, partial [Butyrivibrio sp.]|nr:citrate synthase [Butyrivibrio sp.]